MDLSEYALLAEQKALELKQRNEFAARMKAEAKKLQDELAEALFSPYVGKTVKGDYSHHYTACRDKHYSSSDTQQLFFNSEQRGRPRYSTQGFSVSVEWKDRMEVTLRSIHCDSRDEKHWEGGAVDFHTQALTLAGVLAEEIGKILVI